VDFLRERNQRAGLFVVRIAIAAGLTGAIAACSLNTIATSIKPQAKQSPNRVNIATIASVAAPPETAPEQFMLAAGSAIPAEVVVEEDEAKLRARPYRRIGAPYEIAGSWYEPKEDPNYDQTGEASWYGAAFHGRMTANGEIFDSSAISAAHPTLPLPSYVRVTNLENDRSIVVRVNDRGPFRHKRLIDVSEETARLLGFHRQGMTKVRIQYVAKAPLEGESKADLLASYRGPSVDGVEPAVMLASAQPAAAQPRAPAPAIASGRIARAEPVVAFAEEVSAAKPAADGSAFETLTVGQSAEERISMAFAAADEFFE